MASGVGACASAAADRRGSAAGLFPKSKGHLDALERLRIATEQAQASCIDVKATQASGQAQAKLAGLAGQTCKIASKIEQSSTKLVDFVQCTVIKLYYIVAVHTQHATTKQH